MKSKDTYNDMQVHLDVMKNDYIYRFECVRGIVHCTDI